MKRIILCLVAGLGGLSIGLGFGMMLLPGGFVGGLSATGAGLVLALGAVSLSVKA